MYGIYIMRSLYCFNYLTMRQSYLALICKNRYGTSIQVYIITDIPGIHYMWAQRLQVILEHYFINDYTSYLLYCNQNYSKPSILRTYKSSSNDTKINDKNLVFFNN